MNWFGSRCINAWNLNRKQIRRQHFVEIGGLMDVNEEIVRAWLQLCKNRFTMDNITFKVYGPKGGSNYSNIDLLAVDARGRVFDYEVKWRSAASVSLNDHEWIEEELIGQLKRRERVKRIAEIIGKKVYKRVFVTTHQLFGKGIKKRQAIERIFLKRGIEVIYFEDIIPELIERVSIFGRYDSPILQTIRMLKYFDLVKVPE